MNQPYLFISHPKDYPRSVRGKIRSVPVKMTDQPTCINRLKHGDVEESLLLSCDEGCGWLHLDSKLMVAHIEYAMQSEEVNRWREKGRTTKPLPRIEATACHRSLLVYKPRDNLDFGFIFKRQDVTHRVNEYSSLLYERSASKKKSAYSIGHPGGPEKPQSHSKPAMQAFEVLNGYLYFIRFSNLLRIDLSRIEAWLQLQEVEEKAENFSFYEELLVQSHVRLMATSPSKRIYAVIEKTDKVARYINLTTRQSNLSS